MKQFDVLVPGNYFCDIIFSGLPKMPEMGTEIYTDDLMVVPGGVMNTVIGFRRLGVDVGWIGALGSDFFSRFIHDYSVAEQLDLSLVEQRDARLQRVTVALSNPQERAFVSYIDPEPDVVGMLLNKWADLECRILHFNRLLIDERLLPILRDCKARGIYVSMDCQHRVETLDMPLVQTVLSLVDVFMPNASEALRLTRTTQLETAAKALLQIVPCLIVKDGANGAYAWQNGIYHHAPALQGMQVLDTTGAGDVFNAGFLASHLAGHNMMTCLRWGNIAGGLSVQGYGGCSNAPTAAELKARLVSSFS